MLIASGKRPYSRIDAYRQEALRLEEPRAVMQNAVLLPFETRTNGLTNGHSMPQQFLCILCDQKMPPISDPWICAQGHEFRSPLISPNDFGAVTAFDAHGKIRLFPAMSESSSEIFTGVKFESRSL